VLQYKQRYVDKDTQDFLAMAALQYVIRLIEIEEKEEDSTVVEGIKGLCEKIDLCLSKR